MQSDKAATRDQADVSNCSHSALSQVCLVARQQAQALLGRWYQMLTKQSRANELCDLIEELDKQWEKAATEAEKEELADRMQELGQELELEMELEIQRSEGNIIHEKED